VAQLSQPQREALRRYSLSSDRLSGIVGRIKKHLDDNPHREPAWVLSQDLQSARREFHLAEVEFELAFGVSAQSLRQMADGEAAR
jgi:hypothetical protein